MLAMVGALTCAAPALAAPPVNDDFANAQTLGALPQNVSGTLAEASIESGEPSHSGFPSTASVWYSWTAPATDIRVRLETCGDGSQLSPGLAIYQGATLPTLTKVASNLNCVLKFHPVPSTTYRIAVFIIGGPAPTFELRARQLNPPANDDFANAMTIPAALPQTVNGTNLDATGEASEPTHAANGPNASVWYTWTPLADVRAKIEYCDQLHEEPTNTSVGVYTGASLGSLSPVADNVHSCRIQFDAHGGTSYRIALDTDPFVPEGPFQLHLRQLAPPGNDDLSHAQVLPAGPIQNLVGTTVDATEELSEPNHFGPGGPGPPPIGQPNSVWYEWTSDSTGGSTTIDACSGTFLFVVAVYTGNGYPLTPVANGGACSQTFTAMPSTTYEIAVASHNEDAFTLNPVAPPTGGNPSPGPPPAESGPTGKRAAALKKCKKKHGKARKPCIKHAKRLPV
jgi:hypothetical protein